MKRLLLSVAVTCAVLSISLFWGCNAVSSQAGDESSAAPYISARTPVEAGRYLAIVGNCNDCHTDRYMELDGKVPEEDWLAGSSLGWRGPWGTTYPANLRLKAQEYSEDEWVQVIHGRTAKPPMPWANANHISEKDARALYQYIRSLGPKGVPVPEYVAPDEQPLTPYFLLEPMGVAPQTD